MKQQVPHRYVLVIRKEKHAKKTGTKPPLSAKLLLLAIFVNLPHNVHIANCFIAVFTSTKPDE